MNAADLSPAAIRYTVNSDLVEFLRARFAEDDPGGAWDGPSLREAPRYELLRRVQPYADHPDYRPEWRL